MKIVRVLLAVVAVMVLAGCTASTEPKVAASQSQSATTTQAKTPFPVAPTAENYSMIKYADGRIVVFILVNETGFSLIRDEVGVNWMKEPSGIALKRAEAVQILGDEKTAGVDAKLLPAEKGRENYWITTTSKVGTLLHEF